MAPPILDIDSLRFAYPGGKPVCDHLSFSIADSEIACLLGPSGCGKTTVLRCIAGFESPQHGTITLNGRIVFSDMRAIPPEQRGIGMVFQDYALFPHLTVLQNVTFGIRKTTRQEAKRRADSLLELVRLSAEAKKYPHELSGGQQQRVALARALAPRPNLLLLDEPFSNLDVELRAQLGLEIRAVLKELHTPALLVTHDQHEAFSIADQIGVMVNGKIEQWDSAYNLYHRPASRFVANFVGHGVLLPGRIIAPGRIETELGEMRTANLPQGEFVTGAQADILVRPDDILHDDTSPAQAEVVHKAFRGADILYTLKLPSGATVLSLVPSHHDHAIGQKIGIKLEIDHVVAFPLAVTY